MPRPTDRPDLLFFLRALREADPDFGAERDRATDEERMSREWLIRRLRRTA